MAGGEGLVKCTSNHTANKQKVLPISSINAIAIGTTFSYVVSASEGNCSLSKRAHLVMQVLDPGWTHPSW